MEIVCKYCGGLEGCVSQGKGPHAYEIKCSYCNKHHKWASKYDIETFNKDDLIKKQHELALFIINNHYKPYKEWAAEHKEFKRISGILNDL
jgi:hypothetical protein